MKNPIDRRTVHSTGLSRISKSWNFLRFWKSLFFSADFVWKRIVTNPVGRNSKRTLKLYFHETSKTRNWKRKFRNKVEACRLLLRAIMLPMVRCKLGYPTRVNSSFRVVSIPSMNAESDFWYRYTRYTRKRCSATYWTQNGTVNGIKVEIQSTFRRTSDFNWTTDRINSRRNSTKR